MTSRALVGFGSLLVVLITLAGAIAAIVSCFSREGECGMEGRTLYDSIKIKSNFDAWGYRTQSPSTRFHHLVIPPNAIGRLRLASASHFPGAAPARDWQAWNIAEHENSEAVFVIRLFEYSTVQEAHDGILKYLMSITRMGVDYSPKLDGPGDVLVCDNMARDNLLIRVTTMREMPPVLKQELLRRIDGWLLSDWPAAASTQQEGTKAPLDVRITAGKQTVSVNDPLKIDVEVKSSGERLDLKDVSHRLLAEPGRISWDVGSYTLTSDRPGQCAVSVEAIGPNGEYGKDAVSVKVVHR